MQRVQNRCFCVCVTGMRRKMESWRTVVGAFENSRAEPLMLSFFFLLFICHNIFECARSSAGKRLTLQHPRPGFEPQVCIFAILFFNPHSYAGTILRTTIRPPHLSIHVHVRTRSKTCIQRTRYPLVNALHVTQKRPPGHS